MKRNDDKEVKPGGKALLDVDERLVLALAERDEASRKVSLVYWQDRLARITEDINMLIGIQQRLSGRAPDAIPLASVGGSPMPATLLTPTIPYSHTANIPGNVSSIPRQANPLPSGANVATEIAADNDFR